MLSGRADWKFHPKNIDSKGDDFIYGKKPDFFCADLKTMIGKQIAGMRGKIRRNVLLPHLLQPCRLPAGIAILVDQRSTHAFVKIMLAQYFRTGGKFPLQAFDEARAFPAETQQLQGQFQTGGGAFLQDLKGLARKRILARRKCGDNLLDRVETECRVDDLPIYG